MSQRHLEAAVMLLTGIALVLAVTYVQRETMDLSRFTLEEYLLHGIKLPEWWFAIGGPFIVGLVFSCVAVRAFLSPIAKPIHVFGFCLGLGIILTVFNPLPGLVASVSALCMLLNARQRIARV